MDVPAIVVKPGDGRSVSLGGMGVVFKVRRVYGACSRKAADRSHLGHTELDRWASDHLMICTRSATLLLLPSKRVLLEIRTSLRHCRSPFPGNGILRGRDRRRRKGPVTINRSSTECKDRFDCDCVRHQFPCIFPC
jgi:hypothetical protein